MLCLWLWPDDVNKFWPTKAGRAEETEGAEAVGWTGGAEGAVGIVGTEATEWFGIAALSSWPSNFNRFGSDT